MPIQTVKSIDIPKKKSIIDSIMPREHEDHPLLQDAQRLAASKACLAGMEEEEVVVQRDRKEEFVEAQRRELAFLEESGALDEFRTAAEIMNGSDIGPRGDVVLTVSVPQKPKDGDSLEKPPHMDVILTWAGRIKEEDSGFKDEGIPVTHFENQWNRLRAVVGGGQEGVYTLMIGGITVTDPSDRGATRTEIVENVRKPLKSEWHGMSSEVYQAERRGEGRRKIALPKAR